MVRHSLEPCAGCGIWHCSACGCVRSSIRPAPVVAELEHQADELGREVVTA